MEQRERLYQAIIAGSAEEVKRILEMWPSVIEESDEAGVPLFLTAAGTGNLKMVKYIVEYSRASMNTTDARQRTILHYATESGSLELVTYLVEKVGMEITAGDLDLVTPFDLACEIAKKAADKTDSNEILAYYEARVGKGMAEMYRNPIRTGMFPDPSVVRVGEDYYMVNSSFIYFPCIPISHSRDLVHWQIIGHAVTNPAWSQLSGLEGGRGYWAPDISYCDGLYYITATYRLNDEGTIYRRQMVVTASRPEGPYSEPVFLAEDGIDPSIFHDDDGRHYMLLNRGARIFEIDPSGSKQLSPARLLYYGDCKQAPEGPHLLKKDGYYYLFLAEGGTGPGHRITVARSRELMGNYEPCPYNPIMMQRNEKAAIQRCGHGKPVCTQNGEWFMVYLCGRMINGSYSMLGRETAMDPITWTADGWPIVNNLKGPSVLQKRPGIAVSGRPEEPRQAISPALVFMTAREPEEGAVRWEGEQVKLKGSRFPLSDIRARNILLRRQTDFCFEAGVQIVLPHLQLGQEIGITCYYDENTWLAFYLFCQAGSYHIGLKEHIDETDHFTADENLLMGLKEQDNVSLYVETENLKRVFYYAVNKKEKVKFAELNNVYYLCDEGIKKGKRFTGAMIGMYVYAGEQELCGVFRNFRYAPSRYKVTV